MPASPPDSIRTTVGLIRRFHPPTPGATRRVNWGLSMDDNLHSLTRQLIELRIEHADLDSLIDQASNAPCEDQLGLRRLKKRRLLLRDRIARLEADIEPPEPA